MTRNEAIHLLVQQDLTQLSREEREAMLLDWWSIDANDPKYGTLPDSLKAAIAQSDEPNDPEMSFYDPLLHLALEHSYAGVLNSYLMSRIATLGHNDLVEGAVEMLETCPCCRYRSLRLRGEYEICRVCFWEDDGMTELDSVSGPNHITLREGRLNTQRYGAVTESAREHILPDGRMRYELDSA